MAIQVRITARAERDIEQVLRWFHDQDATAAGSRWLNQLHAKIATLETHPERCRLASEASDMGIKLRELSFGRRKGTYRILFELQQDTVQILHIRHSARDAISESDLQ